MRLIDLALSSVSGNDFEVVSAAPTGTASQTPTARLRYAHYEVSQRANGTPWELGRGAMGITYKAMDVHLGSPVALKVIAPGRRAHSDTRERFLREARSAAQIRHPNIATIHHLGLDEDCCFYAMEYIPGETLEERVRQIGPIPYQTALSITLQCARGLSVAHGQRFIHRDLKPSNIMLQDEQTDGSGGAPVVKLIDFGLVKSLFDGSECNADVVCRGYFAGTPFYASPEQLAGEAVDIRSDIFSLGMCLWFMLAGKSPGSSSTLAGSVQQPHRSWTALMQEISSRFPAPVISLVDSMIAPDASLRPQNTSELIEAIQSCLKAVHRRKSIFRQISVAALLVTGIAFTAPRLFTMNKISGNSMTGSPAQVTARSEAHSLYARAEGYRSSVVGTDNQKAIQLYLEAISRWPDFADAHAGLAAAYLCAVSRFGAAGGVIDQAAASAQRAIDLDPRSPKGFSVLAAVRSWQGQHWESLEMLHHALVLDPAYPPAMRNFSRQWSSVGFPHMALPWAKAAAQLEPANLMGLGIASDALVDLCDDTLAEQSYRQSLQINPAWMVARCGLMHLHLLQGNFEQAKQEYAVAESFESDLLLPMTLKAQTEFFSGDYAGAETTYRRLLAIRRDGNINYFGGISYLSALGYLRLRAGDLTGGNAFLQEAAKLHVMDAQGSQAAYDLAAIRAVQGRKADALRLLEQSIAAGWMDFRSTLLDPRFETLREESQFRERLDALRDRVATMRHQAEMLCAKPLRISDYPIRPVRD